jgi:hypothetical protein
MAKGRDFKILFSMYVLFVLALVAYKLNKALAHEADDDELEIEVAAELANYAE